MELPEVYTVTAEEYESVHAAWCKAIKVLPDHSVLHKQDWYVKEEYRPDLGKEGMGFLARSYEMHFNERPYLNHKCYLFLTKTTKERMRRQSNWSTLCRGHIVPKEIQDRETAVKFIEAVEQFARILNDSGHVRLRRLTDDEITGTETQAGIVGRYLALSLENPDCLEDMEMSAREMRVGDKRLCLHTLSDTEDLPASVETDYRYERLSTDRSDCRLSFAAPLGLLLPCNHIYNQYIFIGNSDEELQRFEKSARNMQSLSRYSRQNAINCEWVEEYLNEAYSQKCTKFIKIIIHNYTIASGTRQEAEKWVSPSAGRRKENCLAKCCFCEKMTPKSDKLCRKMMVMKNIFWTREKKGDIIYPIMEQCFRCSGSIKMR